MMALASMKRPASVAVVVVAIVLAAAASGQAQGMSSHGSRPEGSEGHHDSDGHHRGGSEGHHDGDRDRHRGFDGRGGILIYPPDSYSTPAPTYWYYCSSYGAYYPYVSSCPEAWVPVPAS